MRSGPLNTPNLNYKITGVIFKYFDVNTKDKKSLLDHDQYYVLTILIMYLLFFFRHFFNEITKMSLNSFLIIKLKIYYYKTKVRINNLIIKININEKRKEIKKWHIYTFCVTGQVN